MLSALREAANSFIVKILLGVLVLSFAVWGISGSLVSGPGGAAVEFGGTRVGLADYRLAYNSQVLAYSRQLGTQLTAEQAKAFGIESSVLAQVVAGAVMDENASKLGLGISAAKLGQDIAADPLFKDAAGGFSRERLRQIARSAGLDEDGYVKNRRAVAVRRQLLEAIGGGVGAPQAFLSAFSAYEAERRVLEFVEVGENALKDVAAPGDADLQKFYDTNKILFVAPEYRKIAIVRLTAEDLARPGEIAVEDVAREYEAKKAQFRSPEMRRVQQLVYADRAAAEAALQRVRGGATFEDLLAEAGKSASDTDLGLVDKTQIPDANIADAAFKLDAGAVSDVVDGVFGPVLVRAVEIVAQTTKPLAEVEAELRKALALAKAGDEVFAAHDSIEDARAGGSSLEEAAKAAGLTVRVIEAVDQEGKGPDGVAIADIPESAKLLAQAFAGEPGFEADPVPIGASGFAWFDVLASTPERQKPLDEVRQDVAGRWLREEKSKRVAELAETLRGRIAGGEDFARVAAEALPAKADGSAAAPDSTLPLGRREQDARLGADAIAKAFLVARGGTLVAASPNGETARLIVRVADILAGEKKEIPSDMKARLGETIGEDMLGALVEEFQARGEVKINRRAIELALGR
jgi:peptidyl-prolyl cis-trans isomerase D